MTQGQVVKILRKQIEAILSYHRKSHIIQNAA
jgi:hypothetical protein